MVSDLLLLMNAWAEDRRKSWIILVDSGEERLRILGVHFVGKDSCCAMRISGVFIYVILPFMGPRLIFTFYIL
jgi:hypothetical protein